MYPQSTVDIARQLSDIGILDRENAKICGVSIRSIRHWRRGDRRAQRERRASVRKSLPNCPRCHGRPLDETAYAYLLGLYLGDGHITHRPKTYMLWIACADAWPGLIEQGCQATALVVQSSAVLCTSKKSAACTYVQSVSKHWPCLFPQHGPGRKHERRIELEPWQEEIVAKHPGDFARGLFHSDGCRSMNRVRRPLKDGDRWYEYPRYLFVNHSVDIHRLCGQALDRLGVAWRFSKPTMISVARRDAWPGWTSSLAPSINPQYLAASGRTNPESARPSSIGLFSVRSACEPDPPACGDCRR